MKIRFVCIMFGILAVAFVVYDKQGVISRFAQQAGGWGIPFAILLMAAISITPVPTEFLLIINMKVYGVGLGICYSWVGVIGGSALTLFLMKRFGQRWVGNYISKETKQRLEQWVGIRGTLGLLLFRCLPIPAYVSNYVAGLFTTIRTWDYMWTATVAVLPYYTIAAFVFLGVMKSSTNWLVIGAILLCCAWGLGRYLLKAERKL